LERLHEELEKQTAPYFDFKDGVYQKRQASVTSPPAKKVAPLNN
jgi:hypothetical protein